MPSPFPGMDPYLEDPAFWPSFHQQFICYWCEAINERLPDDYVALVDERIVIDDPTRHGRPRAHEPDIAITRTGVEVGVSAGSSSTTILEPVTLTLPISWVDEARQAFIQVHHLPDHEVVAILELLSPSNKRGTDRAAYLSKRERISLGTVHLIELDLLLECDRLPMEEVLPAGDYFAFVSRGDQRPKSEVRAWTVRQPLPRIPVPLVPPVPDLQIDLGMVLTTTYDRGRYGRLLKYDDEPLSALAANDRDWAAGIVRKELR
jgi:hypothetical protein